MTQATHATGKILRHAHNFEQSSSVVYALPLPFHVVILHGRPARERKKVLVQLPVPLGLTSMLVACAGRNRNVAKSKRFRPIRFDYCLIMKLIIATARGARVVFPLI